MYPHIYAVFRKSFRDRDDHLLSIYKKEDDAALQVKDLSDANPKEFYFYVEIPLQ